MKVADIIIVGGGAAGFFAAVTAGLKHVGLTVIILEQSKDVLQKVKISGGGRCNVTHHCPDPKTLVQYYPRGAKELLGPFYTFGPLQTIAWFKEHGVALKTEADGRMFPVSDSSETIINCFKGLTQKLGIEVLTNQKVKNYVYHSEDKYAFEVRTEGMVYSCRRLMIATGSSPFIWAMLAKHGYKIVDPVPSLFTFNLGKHSICTLMGLSVPRVTVHLKGTKIRTEGPLLITHWGLSGPAVLKASAWGATVLAEKQYQFEVIIDWIPDVPDTALPMLRESMSRKKVLAHAQFGIPSRLWQYLISSAISDPEKNWASLSKQEMQFIISVLKNYEVRVSGKTTFKEEFVTAGGVDLQQINFRTFESKSQPGLFLAGEVLHIDAVTGGFNFQAAWTGGYLAGQAMAELD